MQPIAIATGSGIALETLLDSVDREVPFREIPGIPESDVPGHRRVFLHGRCGEVPLLLQSGRLHFYEGFDYAAVTRTVDYLHEQGVQKAIFINAAGGLDPSMACGDLLAVDRVQLWRYARWNATPGAVFADFVIPDADWTGTFQWIHGPSYETRAEIAALQNRRSAAVGMSTGPELVRCQELGVKAAILSCITNCCYKPQVLTHAEVTATAHRASARIAALIRRVLPQIAAEP